MAAEFLPVVADWFRETYGQPTYPQLHGWQAISEGHHTLIVALARSGKTLAAFLWALDHLYRLGLDGPRLLWDGYPGPRPRSR